MSMDVASFYPGGPDRPRWADARPSIDPADVEECRRRLGADETARTTEEIESHGAASAEELGAVRDLELWGGNPFQEVG